MENLISFEEHQLNESLPTPGERIDPTCLSKLKGFKKTPAGTTMTHGVRKWKTDIDMWEGPYSYQGVEYDLTIYANGDVQAKNLNKGRFGVKRHGTWKCEGGNFKIVTLSPETMVTPD